MIKLTNEYTKLNEKELMLVGGKAGIGKTRYIVNEVNNSQKENKVLFLSLEASKDKLMYDYNLQITNNLTVINEKEQLEESLDKKEYEYLYIDHLGLLKEELDYVKELINKYNIKVFITDFIAINEKDDKYQDDKYKEATSIYVLKEEKIIKIK